MRLGHCASVNYIEPLSSPCRNLRLLRHSRLFKFPEFGLPFAKKKKKKKRDKFHGNFSFEERKKEIERERQVDAGELHLDTGQCSVANDETTHEDHGVVN